MKKHLNFTLVRMKNLIAKEKRVAELLKFGAPKIFIENIGQIEELKYEVEGIDSCYYYLPTLAHYNILKNYTIIPIYDCGETFYVYAYNSDVQKIIYFELECDEVYKDYGQNWNLLLMNIMINYFESGDEEHKEDEFIRVGAKIGFKQTMELFNLINLPIEEYSMDFHENEIWRNEIALKLEIL